MRVFLAIAIGVGTFGVAVSNAHACGLTPPIGPSGLPALCHGDDVPRVHASVAVGGTRTKLDFARGTARLVQGASVASVDVNPLVGTVLEPLTLSLVGGASLGGKITASGAEHVVRPGYIAGIGASYRVGGSKGWPFLQPSVSYSYANGTARAPDGTSAGYRAIDWRLGAAVGTVVGGFAAPFVVGRYFGGGTTYRPLGGHAQDHYRYHLGVGSAFALSQRIDAVVEVAFVGEGRATVGFGYAF